MGRVTGSWERPIQGVSQQSDKDRINGQCTEQVNMMPSPLSGLIKRIGTRHVRRIENDIPEDSLWYSYSRGNGEDYFILTEPNAIPRVFDKMGTERTVVVRGGNQSYYTVPKPVDTLQMYTIADYTFILNKEYVTKMTDKKVPKNKNVAIVYCQYATYGRDYQITIDGELVASFTTPDGSSSEMVSQIKTNYIITKLSLGIPPPPPPEGQPQTGVNPMDKFNVEVHGNTMFITRKDGDAFSVDTVDSADGNDLVAVQDTVKQLANLPPYAPIGHVVKIQNKEGFDAASYWLKAEHGTEGDQTGSKVKWVESCAPNSIYEVALGTMPHTLISEPDGTFLLTAGTWHNRQSGNDDTNPIPSFMDNTITSMGIFQNRIVFTSNEAAVFSRTNNFFDFFRETTQEESEADPIDAYADSNEVNNLYHHAVLDGDIIFFSENGQFLIDGSKPITKENIIFKKVTSYPMNIKAKPAITGESIMFAFESGNYVGIREMFTDSFTDTKRARPITEHVSEYMEGKPLSLVASPNFNTLLVSTDKDKRDLYVYDWLWNGDQKVQSAFHKWEFSGDILFARFLEDKLYLIIHRDSGTYLEYVPISSDADEKGLSFPVRLDQRIDIDFFWRNNRWEFAVPYPIKDIRDFQIIRGKYCWDADKGTSIIIAGQDSITHNWITYDDLADWQSGIIRCSGILGRTFMSRYIPTQPFLKDQNGRVLGLDRFTLGKATLNYESIGNITVMVHDIFSRREWRYEYNGRMMGGWQNRVGFAPLDAGRFQFPLRLPNDRVQFEVITEDYRPFTLRDMEWEGMFKQRGKRL